MQPFQIKICKKKGIHIYRGYALDYLDNNGSYNIIVNDLVVNMRNRHSIEIIITTKSVVNHSIVYLL